MSKISKNQKGFSGLELLMVIVIIVLIVVVGWLVYKNHQKSTTTSSSGNPYAGWRSATLKNEKLSFEYPASWKFTNFNAQSNITDDSDGVTVSSTSGVDVDIQTENDEHPGYDGPRTMVYADPTTFLGQRAYIDYFTDGTSSSDPIETGSVAYSSTDFPASGSGNPLSSPDYLKTKNMSPQGWLLINVYPPQSGPSVNKTDITSNQSYADAKLIVQSMHY